MYYATKLQKVNDIIDVSHLTKKLRLLIGNEYIILYIE